MKQTQRTKILSALQSGARLTPLDAWKRYGCERLAARIYDLTREGYAIDKRMVKTGSGAYVAEYSMPLREIH